MGKIDTRRPSGRTNSVKPKRAGWYVRVRPIMGHHTSRLGVHRFDQPWLKPWNERSCAKADCDLLRISEMLDEEEWDAYESSDYESERDLEEYSDRRLTDEELEDEYILRDEADCDLID